MNNAMELKMQTLAISWKWRAEGFVPVTNVFNGWKGDVSKVELIYYFVFENISAIFQTYVRSCMLMSNFLIL